MNVRPGVPWPPPGIAQTDQGSRALFELLAAQTPPRVLSGLGRDLCATAEAMSRSGPPADALVTAEAAVLIARHQVAGNARHARLDLVRALGTLAAILRRDGRANEADRLVADAVTIRNGGPIPPEHPLVAATSSTDTTMPPADAAPMLEDIFALAVRIGIEAEEGRHELVRRLTDQVVKMAPQITSHREIATAIAESARTLAHIVVDYDGTAALRTLRAAAEALGSVGPDRSGGSDRMAEFRRLAGQFAYIAASLTSRQLDLDGRKEDSLNALKIIRKPLSRMPDNPVNVERLRADMLRRSAQVHADRGNRRRAVRDIDKAMRLVGEPVPADLLQDKAAIYEAIGRPMGSTRQEAHVQRQKESTDPHVLAHSALSLAEAGHGEDAWAAITEAVERYRALVAESRAEFLPYLAMCLGNAAFIASERDDIKTAADFSREETVLYRELHRSWPFYGRDLAVSGTRYLLNLVCAADVDRDEIATVAREVLDLLHTLVREPKTDREPDITTTCHVLARVLQACGLTRLEREARQLHGQAARAGV